MVKKYLTLDGLTEYDGLIKEEIAEGDDSVKSYVDTEVAKKANASHTHDDRYYTETEIDSKISAVNTSITNITSGSTPVKEAEHATNADEATHATFADSATSATKATQDGNGKVIVDTYETKVDANAKLDESKLYTDEQINGHTHSWNDLGIDYDSAETLLDNESITVDCGNMNNFNVKNIELGHAYKVILNGTEYFGFAQNLSNIMALVVLQNEPPIMLIQPLGSDECTLQCQDTTLHQVTTTITIIQYKVNKINTELLDDSIQLREDILLETNDKTIAGAINELYSSKANSTHDHDSTYETKTDASAKLDEAKAYADTAANTVKNDLLNGAGTAYDTLKELGDLIVDNADAIEALETIASGKADATHSHAISEVTGLQSALDGKAASSHGTHVTYDSTNKPKMDGTAAFGTSGSVARADHVHPTDTSRASKAEFDAHVATHAPSNAQANVIESIKVNGTALTPTSKAVNIKVPTNNNQLTNGAGYLVASDIAGKADKSDTYTKSEVDTKTAVDSALSSTSTKPVQNKIVNSAIVTATNAITANTNSITAHNTRIGNLETSVGEFTAITSTEIQNLFK